MAGGGGGLSSNNWNIGSVCKLLMNSLTLDAADYRVDSFEKLQNIFSVNTYCNVHLISFNCYFISGLNGLLLGNLFQKLQKVIQPKSGSSPMLTPPILYLARSSMATQCETLCLFHKCYHGRSTSDLS